MDSIDLSERDICSKLITPAIVQAGWDLATQIREEVSFTRGRIIVRGKLVSRGKGKRAPMPIASTAFAIVNGLGLIIPDTFGSSCARPSWLPA
ncbi:hypothetical protein LAZ29_02465 [Cereibacter sphaeroides]|uniref:hypothetical protein n=1 Tax=Cereibacter sphaeroides TaxID=1063 RepID=UPI001F4046E7|nr:hypothetical protein [Cereibacter sphaeroides]MCE6949786.1 hypothetical protein [Cereibacter sphaeroides]